MSRGLGRPSLRLVCALFSLTVLAGSSSLAHADEQRVSRLGLAIYAMPTSLDLHDVNESINQLNEITAQPPFNLAPIDKITWGAMFGAEAKYFVNRNWALVAGFGRISRQSILDLQPQATTSTTVKAKVRTVPRYLGVDYYWNGNTSGDFTLRPFVGGGYMDLVETKAAFGATSTSDAGQVGESTTALGEGNGAYVEGGIHMIFPSRYSVIVNANYRHAKSNRLYNEETGELVLNENGEPYSVDVSGFGIRFGVQINILGKPAE